jgi:fatty-acyl-CoA synthase
MPAHTPFDTIAFHARFSADATACVDLATGQRLTYRDLDSRVSIAAAHLASRLGNCHGKRIATIARNSAALAIVSAAAERCGAVFVPLNWRLSAPEVSDILSDCEPDLLLVQPEFAGLASEAGRASGKKKIVTLDDIAAAEPPRKSATYEAAGLNDPCIILYTSGTTGRAKGVIITRENALYSSLNFAAVAQVNRTAVLLCDAPMFHTVGLVAITRTAFNRGACVLLSDRFVPGVTLQRLSDPALAVTHYFVVPQMVEALVREPAFAQADLSRLVALFSGGGPLAADLVNTCAGRGVQLINGYGMSEVGSGIHMPVGSPPSTDARTVGYPAPYLDVMLADPDGAPVAKGEVGEIWLRGPSVSPGYWRQPEATAASRSGDWFRSGDLACQQDGAYLIVDRLKDMYISGGENVYPAEVEAVLRQVPNVEDAVVIGVADARWGEVGCAFVQVRNGAPRPGEADMREALATRLARFKQPAHYLFVEAIPRTGSGKPRKNVLREAFLQSKGAA